MVHLPVADTEICGILVVMLALIVGTLAGFFGVGGGFILTPMLNALFGIRYSVAVGSCLSDMVGLSSAASIRHGTYGNIDYRLAWVMLMGSVVGAETGAQMMEWLKRMGATSILGTRMQTITVVMSLIYAALLLWIGWSVRREAVASRRKPESDDHEPHTRLAATLQRIQLRPMISLPVSGIPSISLWVVVGAGLTTGFLSGLLGVGGGFVRMPILIYALGCPTVVAVGTDLFEIVFTAAYGTFTHAMKGNVDLVLVLLMLSGSAVGAHTGALLTKRFDASRVRGGFAILAFAGVVVVVGKFVMTVSAGGG